MREEVKEKEEKEEQRRRWTRREEEEWETISLLLHLRFWCVVKIHYRLIYDISCKNHQKRISWTSWPFDARVSASADQLQYGSEVPVAVEAADLGGSYGILDVHDFPIAVVRVPVAGDGPGRTRTCPG